MNGLEACRTMKLTAAKKIHYDAGPNMVPLVDVALVILIFMMLAGSFGRGEHYLHSDLTTPRTGDGASGLLNEPLVVRLTPGSGDGLAAQFLDQRAASPDALRREMREVFGRLNQAVAHSGEKTLVLLVPSRDVPYQQAIAAYEAIRKAGFTRVSFSG
jgi:biopolymer transport protein ExbD